MPRRYRLESSRRAPAGDATRAGGKAGNYKVLEHFNDFADPWVADLVDQAPTVDEHDGSFGAPVGAELGVALNRDACAEHPRTDIHFNLVEPGWERRGNLDPGVT